MAIVVRNLSVRLEQVSMPIADAMDGRREFVVVSRGPILVDMHLAVYEEEGFDPHDFVQRLQAAFNEISGTRQPDGVDGVPLAAIRERFRRIIDGP